MPSREELETALINAHEAGNKEHATILANALKGYKDTMQDVPIVGGMVSPSEGAKRQMAEMIQSGQIQAGTTLGSRRGVRDVMEGIQQLGLEGAVKAGLISPDQALEFTRQKDIERKAFQEKYGELPGVSGARTVGQTAPYLAIPGVTSLPGMMAVGGLAGGSQYVPEGGSRGTNALIGMAVPAVLKGTGMLGSRIYNAATGKYKTPEIGAVIEAGKKHKVPVYAPDVGGKFTQSTAQLTEEVPYLGMTAPRLAQAKAAKAAAEEVSGQAAGKVAGTGIRGLNIIRESAEKGNKQARVLLNQLNDAGDDWEKILQVSPKSKAFINAQIGGKKFNVVAQYADDAGNVTPKNTLASIDDLIAKERAKVDVNRPLISKLEEYRANLGGDRKFSDLQTFRSDISQVARDNALTDSKLSAKLGELKSAIDDDLDLFIKKSGNPKLKSEWKRANTYWREKVVPLKDKALVRTLEKKNPDELFEFFIKKGRKGRAQNFYNALDPKGKAAARAGFADRALKKAIDGDGNFSPAKYAQFMDDHQDAAGVFFKGSDKAEMDGFASLMRHIKRAGQVMENPPTGNRAVKAAVLTGVPYGIGVQPTTIATAGGIVGGMRLLWTSKAGRNLLAAASKLEPGSKEMAKLLSKSKAFTSAFAASQSPKPVEEK